jgi:hypothetical protein
VLYLGDVGYSTWESLNVVTAPGRNFGWPIFEGLSVHSGYYGTLCENLDAPNPLFGVNGCTQRYFYFRNLLAQDTLLLHERVELVRHWDVAEPAEYETLCSRDVQECRIRRVPFSVREGS